MKVNKIHALFPVILILNLITSLPAFSENAVFTVTSAASTLRVTGNTSGFDLIEQVPGSNITSYSGTITADITGTSVKIISADLTANIKGNFQPGINGEPFSALLPAQYGLSYDYFGFFPPGHAAIRGLKLNFNQISPRTLTGNSFTVAEMISAVTSGGLDAHTGEAFGAQTVKENIPLAGNFGLNTASTNATLTTTATTQTMVIPVNFTMMYGDFSSMTFEGSITSTRSMLAPRANPPADFNGDCLTNTNDWNVWKLNFGKTNATLEMGDANGDKTIDAADYTLWKNNENIIPPACTGVRANAPADFNGDCQVNTLDQQIWSRNYGSGYGTLETGDINGDRYVNGSDFLAYQRSIGTTPPSCVTASGSASIQQAIQIQSGTLSVSRLSTTTTPTTSTTTTTTTRTSGKSNATERFLKVLYDYLKPFLPKGTPTPVVDVDPSH